MRKTNVFGKKQSQIRPFFVFLAVFIVLVPAYLLVDYVFEQELTDLQDQGQEIQREIDQLISTHQSSGPGEISAGMIYTGFESYYFDYYLQDQVVLLLNQTGIVLEPTDQIIVSTSSNNPISTALPEDIVIKEINADITVNNFSQIIDFMNLLIDQDQLYYIDTLQSALLEDGSYHIQMSFYVFYLENEI